MKDSQGNQRLKVWVYFARQMIEMAMERYGIGASYIVS